MTASPGCLCSLVNPDSLKNKIPVREIYMKMALAEARRAAHRDEVPVGAVLVKDGKVVQRGFNRTRMERDPTQHAEMVVITRYAKKNKNERLTDVSLYVTLEPCAMCAGAVVQSRIPLVVYGCADPKAGACGSVLRVLPNRKLNHRPVVVKKILARECAKVLSGFFREKRMRGKPRK